jgi:hypothetical protein
MSVSAISSGASLPVARPTTAPPPQAAAPAPRVADRPNDGDGDDGGAKAVSSGASAKSSGGVQAQLTTLSIGG